MPFFLLEELEDELIRMIEKKELNARIDVIGKVLYKLKKDERTVPFELATRSSKEFLHNIQSCLLRIGILMDGLTVGKGNLENRRHQAGTGG